MEYTFYITVHLNAKFQPADRFELEDALQSVLERLELGEVDGGGTAMSPSGEISSCDIEVCLKDNSQETINKLSDILNHFGIPKGSKLQYQNALGETTEINIGGLEGLALYLNGTDLPTETYKNCDINYVIEKINELLQDSGSMFSYWEGPSETALYFYGESYENMLKLMQPFLNDYPLCEKCRVAQIA